MLIEEFEKLLSEATDAEYGSHSYAGKLDRQLCDALRNAAPALIAIVKAAKAGPCRHYSVRHLCDLCKALQKLEEV